MFANVAPQRQTRRSRSPIRAIAGLCLAVAAFAFAAAPAAAKPDPIRAVVGVRAVVPAEARTAHSLGTERQGNGIVIDAKGLVLTIGYLIMEAQSAEIYGPDGKTVPAAIVAYDHQTGFGLLRATAPLGIEPVELGSAADLKMGARVLAVGYGGPRPVVPAQVVSRRSFAGYWEYLLDGAIFTMPPHPVFGGAALIAEDGKLVGVGSLFVNDAIEPSVLAPGNMFIPIDLLKPILPDLLTSGRSAAPPKPWIGVHVAEAQGRVVVVRTSDEGPAKAAGIVPGDIIIGVDGKRVTSIEDFLRKAWAQGSAGTAVPLDIVKANTPNPEVTHVKVQSIDRHRWLKIHRGY